jgi:hypothetical protein
VELVGAVKLAGAPKADDGVKGQIYNRGEARNHFPLGLESAPLSLHPLPTISRSHGQYI